MKRFKHTLIIAAVFTLVFLSIRSSPENPGKITVSSVENQGSYTYVTGNVTPFKAYKGYEYSSNNGECYIKIYSSLRFTGGTNEFKIHVGDFEKIYLTDGKIEKEIK